MEEGSEVGAWKKIEITTSGKNLRTISKIYDNGGNENNAELTTQLNGIKTYSEYVRRLIFVVIKSIRTFLRFFGGRG